MVVLNLGYALSWCSILAQLRRKYVDFFLIYLSRPLCAQSSLVDYLCSPSDIPMQKTVPPLFIAFSNWNEPPSKISGCVSLAPRTHFFHKNPPPPLWRKKINEFKGGPLWKKCFLGAKETHPDILRGGHRNPIPIGKCNKKWWDSFLHLSLGLNSLPGSCVHTINEKEPILTHNWR